VEVLLGEAAKLLTRDGFDASQDFIEREEAAEIQLLAGQVGHAGTGGFEREHERALEMVLRAAQLFFGDESFLESAKFLNGEIEDLADGFFGRARVDGHHAGIGIGSELAENGVGKALLFADVLEEAGGHAAAEEIIEDGDAEAVLMSERNRRNADAKMDLLEVALGLEMDGRMSSRSGVGFGRTAGREMAEITLDQLEDLIVGDVAGGRHDEMAGGEPVAEAGAERIATELLDGGRSAKNGAAERVLGPETARENVMEEVFGIVHVHLDFFEDDLALFFHVIGVEFGTKNEVGDDVEGDGEMLVENFGVETDLFLGSEGVQHAADGIHFAGDVLGGASFGALENHVLDEVGEAVFFGDFAAGAVANPDANGNGADMAHGLGQNDEAVGKKVLLDVARLTRHEGILTHGKGNYH